MLQKQLSQYLVIEHSLEGGISVKEAAEVLNLSTRQIIMLRNGVREQGADALIHKNQGRPPAYVLAKELKKEPNTYRPPETQSYKKGKELVPKVSFEEGNREILEMLEEVFLGKQESFF